MYSFSCSHLAQLNPFWMCTRWEEIVYDNCHVSRAPHKFSLFARPLFPSSLFWLSWLHAIISKLIYMLMSLETDVYCHTQMPDFARCSSKGLARGRSEAGFLARKRQTLKYRPGHALAQALYLSPLEKGDSGITDPWYTSLPAFRGRRERSFCQCHDESPGHAGKEEGYRRIYGKKGGVDSNCK